ncbi:MAG: hypothetical protein JNM47_08780 [Hyphomonadaceae bacterium]|nr:hypothetical protein [Hyphomonadaceae bacterium]
MSAVKALTTSGVQFAIAGGWVPVLREAPAGIIHPGTRDVDVLLSDSDLAVEQAARSLLSAGFHPSAKHEFQLLREATVGARKFLFNVDLMHPREAQIHPGLYEDIIDLGITDRYDPTGKRWLKSIAFKSSAIVFEKKLWATSAVEARSFEGTQEIVDVPLLTPSAFILSKCQSVAVEKRTRDAFDLYYVFNGPDAAKIVSDLTEMCSKYPEVRQQVSSLKSWIDNPENASVFDRNVDRHAKATGLNAASGLVMSLASALA